ncbi:heme exporter protein CcmD [Zoogloea sp.]|uniref:heme exporter protein CcmD n=1 Tax=Zoogloea sp. TaxID=49181 RepID=UPI00261016CC|nr:heme exporter protein CcmD [Zoogloea sp.]MDD3352236.1 heme exporter protein CcmD [Zoogloea sp.]
MNWGSTSDFLAMGGYGLYVWGSFGVTAAALLVEVILVRQRLRNTRRALRREISANRNSQD